MSLIKIHDASKLLQKSVSTIHKWTAKKKIPHIKIGGCTFFDPVELENWIRAHAVPMAKDGGK